MIGRRQRVVCICLKSVWAGGQFCLRLGQWIQPTSPRWSIKVNQTLLSLHISHHEIMHKEGKYSLLSTDAEVQPAFQKLPSWLTHHWTSRLCLVAAANVSRCLFRVHFQSLIYAWDDNAILHVILQESEESITNGIHAKQVLLFALSVPPRFSADTLTSAEHRLRAHTVCHNSFSSITAGPAGLSLLYLQLGKLTPLNSKNGGSFWKGL